MWAKNKVKGWTLNPPEKRLITNVSKKIRLKVGL